MHVGAGVKSKKMASYKITDEHLMMPNNLLLWNRLPINPRLQGYWQTVHMIPGIISHICITKV